MEEAYASSVMLISAGAKKPPTGKSNLKTTMHQIIYLLPADRCFFIEPLASKSIAATSAIDRDIPANVSKKSLRKAVISKNQLFFLFASISLHFALSISERAKISSSDNSFVSISEAIMEWMELPTFFTRPDEARAR